MKSMHNSIQPDLAGTSYKIIQTPACHYALVGKRSLLPSSAHFALSDSCDPCDFWRFPKADV